MQSKAADVFTYIAEAPADRRAALTGLRELALAELPDAEEGMDYGMPCYKRDGAMTVAFASQKGYIAFYGIRKETVERHSAALGKVNCGKSCLRFARPEQINFDLLRQMLREERQKT